MRLIHFTEKPIAKLEYKKQDPKHFKPTGLWVSDEDEFGWKEWCTGEGFRTEALTFMYEVTLAENHNVRIITTAEEIQELTRDYPDKLHPGFPSFSLNWLKIRKLWDGLIITPYHWNLRLETDHMWYYAWDCASGCIWNPAVIKIFPSPYQLTGVNHEES